MLVPREEGQGLVEYALIILLMALLLIAALTLLNNALAGIFSSAAGAFGT